MMGAAAKRNARRTIRDSPQVTPRIVRNES
jgi:hypothetical protein